jgi:hypothetical protein
VTELPDDLTAALQRLRSEVRDRVPVPVAARVRARATHQLRVRRTTAALLAAATVAALAVGGAQLLPLAAAPPVLPVGPPSPTVTPMPTATAPSPGPPEVPAVAPSPRPAPLAVEPLDDPIAAVDWFEATIDVPPHEFCPSGPIRLARYTDEAFTAARAFVDGTVFEVYPAEVTPFTYGDLTGDGRPEVVMEVQCFLSDDGTGFGAGHGGHLLVVSRDRAGGLTGLAWVGPGGADIMSVWVSDGRLLLYGDPWVADPEDIWTPVPGLALAYRWNGTGFDDWVPAPEYPPLMSHIGPANPGAPVLPRAVAGALGCPDVELRFRQDEVDSPHEPLTAAVATGGGATWVVPDRSYHLLDLDRTGDRLLVLAVECTDPDGWTRAGLAVFERAGDGWQGISVLTPPDGYQRVRFVQTIQDDLVVDWDRVTPEGSGSGPPIAYRWTGTVLGPVDR